MSTDLLSHLTFGDVNKGTIGLLKVIHRELLPVHYQDSIYNVIKEGKQAKGALAFLYGDTAVGEVCFRIEDHDGVKKIYIMTIGVLKTYQKLGLGRKLLEHAMEEGQKWCPEAKEIFLHVHVENESAMQFYEKMGFAKGELNKGYYKSLDNGDAYTFTKML